MKKVLKQSVFPLLAILFAMASCQGNSTSENRGITTDSICLERVDLLKNDTNTACRITINFGYIDQAKDSTLKDSINRELLRELLGSPYENMTVQQAIDSFTTNYIATYKKEMAQLLEGESAHIFEGAVSVFNYSKILKNRMIYNANNILTFRADVYEYTGGAHGMSNSFLFNFDLRTGKRILLSDLFIDKYEERLNDILTKQLMENNNVHSVKELEELGYFITSPIFPSENFYFEDAEIVFVYNPYEIAPYAMGSTEIKLPISELNFLLKENSPIAKLAN